MSHMQGFPKPPKLGGTNFDFKKSRHTDFTGHQSVSTLATI
jgi:hypothetical protein